MSDVPFSDLLVGMAYLSNVDTFYEMAEESYVAMENALRVSQELTPDRKKLIVHGDKKYFASKQAFIVVAFCAIHFEALIFILAHKKLGLDGAMKIDRKLYEERLIELGCPHQSLIDQARVLRELRKEMVHEKAIDLECKPDLNSMNIRMAWEGARDAISFIRALRANLLST